MCSGFLERYRNLRFAFLEGGCNWVASYVERMDDHFENPRYNARQLLDHPPSEYLNSGRIFFGCEGNEPNLGRMIQELGKDKLLFPRPITRTPTAPKVRRASSRSATISRRRRAASCSKRTPRDFTAPDAVVA
jgi:hypothetical protein